MATSIRALFPDPEHLLLILSENWAI